jgi:hypothetical protein
VLRKIFIGNHNNLTVKGFGWYLIGKSSSNEAATKHSRFIEGNTLRFPLICCAAMQLLFLSIDDGFSQTVAQ